MSDWEGDWQSVYPYLLSGDLDEVFAHKAENGDMTKEKYMLSLKQIQMEKTFMKKMQKLL